MDQMPLCKVPPRCTQVIGQQEHLDGVYLTKTWSKYVRIAAKRDKLCLADNACVNSESLAVEYVLTPLSN